jgi:ribosome-associated translation inhibitor RaiA
MKFHVEARELHVDPQLRSYIHRVVSFTTRYFPLRACRVEIETEATCGNDASPIRCTIEAALGELPRIRSEASGASVSEALHEACDRLERRLGAATRDFDDDVFELRAA